MALTLSALLIVAVVAVGLGGLGGYRYYRQRSDTESPSDSGDAQSPAPAHEPAEGMAGLTGPDASAPASDRDSDPVTAFELDPEVWAPLAQSGQRMARLRGALRGARQAARLVGEPDMIFEHRDGALAVGLDAERPYQGHPQWREVSTLTLQMGVTKLRWPKAEVMGIIRYTDGTVAVPYKEALYSDLERAARNHKGKSLPSADELSGKGARDHDGSPDATPPSSGLLARLRSAIADRSAHLAPRRYQRQ